MTALIISLAARRAEIAQQERQARIELLKAELPQELSVDEAGNIERSEVAAWSAYLGLLGFGATLVKDKLSGDAFSQVLVRASREAYYVLRASEGKLEVQDLYTRAVLAGEDASVHLSRRSRAVLEQVLSDEDVSIQKEQATNPVRSLRLVQSKSD